MSFPPHPSILLHIPPPHLLSWSRCCFLPPPTPPEFTLSVFPHSSPRGREGHSGLFRIVIPLFPLSSFVTSAANTVLRIFTSCSGYYLPISVGNKCAILHSLLLRCFNVNIFTYNCQVLVLIISGIGGSVSNCGSCLFSSFSISKP